MNTFDDFWRAYPRKVAKRAAFKEWEKEMRAGTDPAEIIAGLERQLPAMARKDIQFIPHARTWLHQGRWEDEPEPISGNRTFADVAAEMMRTQADEQRGNRPAGGNVEWLPARQRQS